MLEKLNLIIVDIETTGLNKYNDKIIELAYIKIKDGIILEKYNELINPEKDIPPFITKLTGINNNMVKNKNNIKTIIKNFYDNSRDYIFVAHNVKFDYTFLNYNLHKFYNLDLNLKHICTCDLAKLLKSNLHFDNCKLNTLCTFYNIKNNNHHRAMNDVLITYELLKCYFNEKNHNLIIIQKYLHKNIDLIL